MEEIKEYKKRLTKKVEDILLNSLMGWVQIISVVTFIVISPILWIWVSLAIAWKVFLTSLLLATCLHYFLDAVKKEMLNKINSPSDKQFAIHLRKIIDKKDLKKFDKKFIEWLKDNHPESPLLANDDVFNDYIKNMSEGKSKFQQRLDNLRNR